MTLTQIKSAGLSTPVDLADNAKIRLGTGADLEIYHDGSHSLIKDTGTGDLKLCASKILLTNAANSERMIDAQEDSNVELYYDNVKKAETTANGFFVTGSLWADGLYLDDNEKIHLGTSGTDLQLYHDGTASLIENGTGNLALRAKTAENSIVMIPDSKVALYFDNSKKFETNSAGVEISGHIYQSDDNKLLLGTSQDLQLWHAADGNSRIYNVANTLYIRGARQGFISSGESEWGVLFTENGSVNLYYDGAEKLATLSTGTRTSGNVQLPFVDANNGLRNKISWVSEASYFDEVAYIAVDRTASSGAVSDMVFATGSANAVSEKMRIHSNQFISVGTTDYQIYNHSSSAANDQGVVLDTVGSIQIARHNDQCLLLNRMGTDGTIESFYNDGTYVGGIAVSGGTTVYATSSDYRLKENVVTLSNAITRLKTLKPYRYNFIGKSLTMDGFFAHEVTAVPEAIVGEKDAEEMQGLDYAKLTPLLTAALQEAVAKIETLETKVAALEAG